IDRLNADPFEPDSVHPPHAWCLPQEIEYDLTMARGSDRLTIEVIVAVSRTVDEVSWRKLLAYADGTGDRSVKQVLESGSYTELESLQVLRCEFGRVDVGGVLYLAGRFNVDILGSGE